MVIKVLVENTTLSSFYGCQHGLSLYVETKNHKLLFDLGQNELFYENAQKLDVDIGAVDTVIISHGHYDHGGGLGAFLEHNSRAKVYIHKLAFGDYYSQDGGAMHYIGLKKQYENHPQLCFVENDLQIDKELFLFSDVLERNYHALSNDSLKIKRNETYVNDMFLHEQNLIITEGSKKVLFSGCAHSGIISILNKAEKLLGREADAVFSGFHLANPHTGKAEALGLIDAIGSELSKRKTRYFTGHCTGQIPYDILKNSLKDQMDYIATGTCLII